MSNLDTHADTRSGAHGASNAAADFGHSADRRVSTETKASFKTTELIAYVAAVIAVLVASAIVDSSDFGPQEAWRYVTYLTIGYMISRGLAKSGSREHYDDADSAGRSNR